MNLATSTALVIGFGKTGVGTCRFLQEEGARVYVAEDTAAGQEAVLSEGYELFKESFWPEVDFVVVSPGIAWCWPIPHPLCLRARQEGVALVTDVDLFAVTLRKRNPKACLWGITGTNGKSTTTALLDHSLRFLGHSVAMGGNIGVPVLDLPFEGVDHYVLELSSYQLELSRSLFLDMSIHLNISPDHLGRHGGMEGYIMAKQRIFEGLHEGGYGIIGVDDLDSAKMYDRLREVYGGRLIPLSTQKPLIGGIFISEGQLMDARSLESSVCSGDVTNFPALRGEHNLQNLMAVYGAISLKLNEGGSAALCGKLFESFQSFPGLAHRQERVLEAGGVLFINDSKATNANSVAKALPNYENVYWIAGGRAKESGLRGLEPFLSSVRHCYLIGEAAEDFSLFLKGCHVEHSCVGTLEKAVEAAYEQASLLGKKAVVLLSPACASWDQFANFEERGDAFKACVQRIAHTAA